MRSIGKRIFVFLTVTILLLAAAMPVFADFGPKPSITIFIENPPKEEYYLDLLIPDFAGEPYSNLREDGQYDEAMLAVLRDHGISGWHAAFTVGTRVPLFGKLTGTPVGGGMEHCFSYFGTPDRYRIILVTKSGGVYLSEVIEKQIFQERLTVKLGEGTISESENRTGTPYTDGTSGQEKPPIVPSPDENTGTITLVKQPSKALLYLYQFALTLIPTLILEFAVLLILRIPVKKNLYVFLGVNVLTQILLTVIMMGRLLSGGIIDAYLIFVPLEIGILAVECILYYFLLRDVAKKRRILYAITANVFSAAAGVFLIRVIDHIISVS